MRVLITGAAGRIGRETCDYLLAQGIPFSATDARYRSVKDFPFRVANLLDPSACYELVEGHDCIIHLGNIPNQHSGSLPQAVYVENTTINMNLFQAAAEVGVQKIIFASTIQVIDSALQRESGSSATAIDSFPLDGETLARPCNAYALSKHASEFQLEYFARNSHISAFCLRLPHVVPRKAHPSYFKFPTALPEAIHGLPLILAVEDAAELFSRIAETNLPGFRTYFPVANCLTLPISPMEFIAKYFPNTPIVKPMDGQSTIVDISRITAETGWRPKVNTIEEFQSRICG